MCVSAANLVCLVLKKYRLLFAVALVAVLTSVSFAQTAASSNPKVEKLLQQMTLDEKIGQLTQAAGFSFPGMPSAESLIEQGKVGSVLWVNDPKEINRLQRLAVEKSRLHVPLLVGLDIVHGYRTIFPMPLAMASSWDPKMVEQVQTVAAREARASGINWTFAPMVDIARDARWGRIVEGAGEDPFLGAAMARAQVRGFQGTGLPGTTTGVPDRVLACVKHFAAYGAGDGGRDYDSAYVPDVQLWNVYFPPFKAAVDAGVGSLMSAYMDLNDVPATGNTFLMQDVLRKTWKFNGFVISDAMAIGSLVTHGQARDGADAALKAFTAGINMDMVSGTYPTQLAALVKSGQISEAALDDAVRPLLAAKFNLGLFDNPYVDEGRVQQITNAPEHAVLARQASARSMVLLKNEKNLLPLDPKALKSVAVIGPLADATADLNGFWGGILVTARKPISVADGIKTALGPNVRLEVAHGPNIRRRFVSFFAEIPKSTVRDQPVQSPKEAQDAFDEAVATAKRNDAVVMVMGETALMAGEAASVASLQPAGRQQELLEAVVATGKPVVLVLVNGRPLDISWAAAHVPAILEAWTPGVEGGSAIADVLFGAANPGGKLPVVWPRDSAQEPLHYGHNLTHQPDTAEGFTSRYWDMESSPLYPFGFGLSYSSFELSNLRLNKKEVASGEPIEVSVDLKNTSSRAGDEVIQLYIHQRAGSASRPARQLKGFQRVTLQPGEKTTVRFSLGKGELSYWSPVSKTWVLEPEAFDVWVGADSTATAHAEFKVVAH
jgi:beta-glucosidase